VRPRRQLEREERSDRDRNVERCGVETLREARAGDLAAGERLVQVHGASMMRTAWRVAGPSDAEDAVQEAFLAALTTDALPDGDLGAWLRAIAARKALDGARARTRRREAPLPETKGETSRTDASARIDAALDAQTALALLSPVDRALLTLVDLEGFEMADAARRLGLTRVAAKLRASRARRKLARALSDGIGGVEVSHARR